MSKHTNNELSHSAITAWARLIRVSQSLLNDIETELKAADLPSLSWYDVLLELSRDGVDGLRPYELQENMLLSQYNISRLVNRMANAGYVECVQCDEDKRGQVIYITQSGRALQKEMWITYKAFIAQRFANALGDKDIENLALVLSKLYKK